MLKVANSVISASRIATPITFVGDVTLSTGNLVIGTAGKGIDFSATPGTGTSELLADYEEGTWTPTDASGASLSFVASSGYYTRIGRLVNITLQVQYPVTASVNDAAIGGLPFNSASAPPAQASSWGYTGSVVAATLLINASASTILVYSSSGGAATNANMSGTFNFVSFSYIV